jgi:4-amino-4-deoxy-L-arabinose transferase-like glycosyltransferase
LIKGKWKYLVFLLIAVAFFSGQYILELRAEEPRRAFVSMEMMLNGDYIVPHVNGWPYFNKPPLFNWLQIVFFKLFHSFDEWVARMPSLLSFLLMAFLTFKVSARYLNKNLAVLIALATLTSADLLFYGTVNSGEIDLFYSLLVFIQLIAIFHFSEEKKWLLMFIVSYAFMALGFLTKGPPSLAFQFFTLITWFVYKKHGLKLLSFQHLSGLFIAILIIGSYFLLYDREGNAMDFMGRLFAEASQKSGAESSAFDILKNTLLFPLRIIKIILPWSLLLVFIRWKKLVSYFKSNSLFAFSCIFIVSNLWLYWFTGESKDRYIYMFIPFIIIILLHFYNNAKHIYYLALSLLLIRVVFNFTYLPILDNSEVAEYREISNDIISYTKDEDLYFFSRPQTIESKIKLGPLNIYENQLETAPLLAYQLNYYISKSRNQIIPFVTNTNRKGFYIVPEALINLEQDSVVYRFHEKWQHIDRALIWKE